MNDYLVSRRAAWFAFAMTLGLMIFDYVDRQVIVSLFPYLKAEWNLSDKQLGALVSVVSVVVAIGALPIALLADRTSRVKSIVIMATAWSLATIGCVFTRNYSQLFAARALVGLGEAGYGSVGAALIASLFPARMRGALLAAFFAAASAGSVLGVLLGGLIAARWGWQAAFGVVGVPGLLLALLYLKVPDYRTVELTPALTKAASSTGSAAKFIARALVRSRTMLWVCLAGAAQLIVVSAVWAWLPSYLNRFHGVAPGEAGIKAALVVLCGALGSVLWGALIDRLGSTRPRARLYGMAVLCVATFAVLVPTFSLPLAAGTQFALVAVAGFIMTCTVGPVSAVVTDVVHPGVRATGLSVLALFQNLLGLAAGPFIAGALSDAYGLETALRLIPAFGLAAAAGFAFAARSYVADMRQVHNVRAETPEPGPLPASHAVAS
jgi:MFS transporter, Spinster family, sphingosine-1-phosphate transporter